MEKGLNHNTMYVRLFLLSFHNFHFIFSCGLQLNSCKVFFLWLVLASFIFFKNQVIVGKTLQFAKRYWKKKKKTKQTNKQARRSVSQFTLKVGQNYFKECRSVLCDSGGEGDAKYKIDMPKEYCTIHRLACENSNKRYCGKSLKFLLDKPLVTILLL